MPWLTPEEVTVKVIRWLVAEGDLIEIDQDILLLEVAGEEYSLPSSMDAKLCSLLVEPGDLVDTNQPLALVEIV